MNNIITHQNDYNELLSKQDGKILLENDNGMLSKLDNEILLYQNNEISVISENAITVTQNEISHFELLPLEIQKEILLNLNYKDILHIKLTNKKFSNICNDELWYNYLKINYANSIEIKDEKIFTPLEIIKWIHESKSVNIRYSNPHSPNILTNKVNIAKYSYVKDIINSFTNETKLVKILGKNMQLSLEGPNIIIRFANGPKFNVNNHIRFGEIIPALDCSVFELMIEINVHTYL
jgi:hypothetical protein